MNFPIAQGPGFQGIPINRHPGAFGVTRLHDIHTGVDLYTREGAVVFAMTDGEVVGYEQFTGPPKFPWWNTTSALIVKLPYPYLTGDDFSRQAHYICYGEIVSHLKAGDKIYAGTIIGNVVPVLARNKVRADIPGHSHAMLHLEMYDQTYNFHENYWDVWELGEKPVPYHTMNPAELDPNTRPKYLVDPTALLIRYSEQKKFLTV